MTTTTSTTATPATTPKPTQRLRTGVRAGYTDDSCMFELRGTGPRRITR